MMSTAVAIGAPHVAFLDLGHDPSDRPVPDVREVERLVAPDVVELQNDRIGLTAVDARVLDEVLADRGATALAVRGLRGSDLGI